ncbi:MAG: hypothetical protein AAF515_12585 [Pseudomonadota bacterium]
MPSLALLSSDRTPNNDNQRRISAALGAAGWFIERFPHTAVGLRDGVVVAGNSPLDDFDLVWMLGLGSAEDFLDRCQILAELPPGRMVNSASAMLELHAKHVCLPHAPPAASGCDAASLLAYCAQRPDIERWVVKPSAGSFGRDIRVCASADELERAITQATAGDRYCVVQAFIDEISTGEVRSLVVGGRIIGSYRRVPDRSYLANLSQGARAQLCALSDAERAQIEEVAAVLDSRGARFAAVDMAFPYLVETNIANPGGLATIAGLEGPSVPGQAPVNERLAAALGALLD